MAEPTDGGGGGGDDDDDDELEDSSRGVTHSDADEDDVDENEGNGDDKRSRDDGAAGSGALEASFGASDNCRRICMSYNVIIRIGAQSITGAAGFFRCSFTADPFCGVDPEPRCIFAAAGDAAAPEDDSTEELPPLPLFVPLPNDRRSDS